MTNLDSYYGPCREGGVYFCGYWQRWYYVLGFEECRGLTWIHVMWEDGSIGCHMTGWCERTGDAVILDQVAA